MNKTIALLVAVVLCLWAAPAFAQEPTPPPTSGGGGTPWPSPAPGGGGGTSWPMRSPFPVPSNDPGPGLLTLEAAEAQGEKLSYNTVYELTGGVWGINKAMFEATHELDRFHTAIVENFALVLDAVAPALLPIFRRLVLLAVPLSLICYLWVGVVSIELASLRRVVLLCVVVPSLFVSMGFLFGKMVDIRMSVAREFGALTFDTISLVLGNDTPIAYGTDGNRLVEIAATAMYLDPADVAAASDMAMPERFVSGVYTLPATNWGSVGAQTRAAYKIQANEGFRIMVMAAIGPSPLMLLDTVLQTLWDTVLGGAFLGLAFAMTFAMFASFAGEAYRLFITIFNLVLGSWIIASFQGMLIACLFYLTTNGSILGVVVISFLLCFIYAVFIGAVVFMGAKVLSMSMGVFMPDMPDTMQRSSRRVGGAVWGGIAGGVMGGVAGVMGVLAGGDVSTPAPIPNQEA